MGREDVNIKVSANIAEAIQMWKAMEAGPEGMAKAIEGMGHRGKSSTKGISDEIGSMIGKFAGAQAIIDGLKNAFQEMEQAAQGAAERAAGALDSAGQLAQVATSPADYEKLLNEGRDLVYRGIFKPEEQAAAHDLVFTMRNAGFADADREYLASLGENRVVAPSNLGTYGESLAKIRDIYGTEETGSISDISSKVLAGAGITQANASEFAASTTRFGSTAQALGYSDEESLAGITIIEKGSGNIERASTRYDALLSQIDKKKLNKGTQLATFDAIQAQLDAGRDIRKVLGDNQEAVAGFRAFQQNRGEYGTVLESITTAPQRDIVGDMSKLIQTDPQNAAALQRAKSMGREAALHGHLSATEELLWDAYMSERRAATIRQFGKVGGGFVNAFESVAGGVIDLAGLEGWELGALTERDKQHFSPDFRMSVNDYQRRRQGQQPVKINITVGVKDNLDVAAEPEAILLSE